MKDNGQYQQIFHTPCVFNISAEGNHFADSSLFMKKLGGHRSG